MSTTLNDIKRTAALAKYILSLAFGEEKQAEALDVLAKYLNGDGDVIEVLNALVPELRVRCDGIAALIKKLDDILEKLSLSETIGGGLSDALEFSAYAGAQNIEWNNLINAAWQILELPAGDMWNAIKVAVIQRALEMLLDFGNICSYADFATAAIDALAGLSDADIETALDNEPTFLRENYG